MGSGFSVSSGRDKCSIRKIMTNSASISGIFFESYKQAVVWKLDT